MLKGLLVGLVLGLSQVGLAAPTVFDLVQQPFHQAVQTQVQTQALNWKVGDTNNYNVNMGFIKGTMTMTVREIVAEGIWVDQNVDLGFLGKQVISTLIDPNTGEVKKMIVNGKEEQIPQNNMEVVEVKEDRITVPAGTFDCIHAVLKDKETQQVSNAWLNPQLIPLSGMVKSVQPGQMGEVTLELTSFIKK